MTTAPENLLSVFDGTFMGINQALENFTPQLTPREVGTITNIAMHRQGFRFARRRL